MRNSIVFAIAATIAATTPNDLVAFTWPLSACSAGGAPRVVYQNDPSWTADLRGSATAAITTANPRSGNGSLELAATGDLLDWGFYRHEAPSGSFGLLSQLECLSFDWFRESIDTPTDVPWSAQTPVLRLYVNDMGVTSELVWEKYYTDGSPTENDVWHTQDLIGQNFWRVIPGQGYTIAGCAQVDPFFPNPLLTMSPSGWAGGCYSENAFITAIAAGAGSDWPWQYRGFVDNVRMGFAGQETLAVNDNFEVQATPEPATMALLATGLAAMMGTGLVRRRRRKV
ncbi:MAG: PEP-CTERM sorting domain-containing protein, partial [Gemmatimonadales bacterium]